MKSGQGRHTARRRLPEGGRQRSSAAGSRPERSGGRPPPSAGGAGGAAPPAIGERRKGLPRTEGPMAIPFRATKNARRAFDIAKTAAMDDVDRQILALLRDNARESFTE